MQTIPEKGLDFLRTLKKNNNREWFNQRKAVFKELEKEVKGFYDEVEKLLKQHDDIQKTKAYRIYRDIRFSKDKTPYKSHFAVNFQRRKPQYRGGYYLHIAPDNQSMIGTGFWDPNRDDLKRVRKEWEIESDEIREVLEEPSIREYWGEMQGHSLKTAPRGFDREDPGIDLINHKQWIFRHDFTDEEVLADDFAYTVDAYFRAIRPFFDYMSAVLTTDLNGVSLLED